MSRRWASALASATVNGQARARSARVRAAVVRRNPSKVSTSFAARSARCRTIVALGDAGRVRGTVTSTTSELAPGPAGVCRRPASRSHRDSAGNPCSTAALPCENTGGRTALPCAASKAATCRVSTVAVSQKPPRTYQPCRSRTSDDDRTAAAIACALVPARRRSVARSSSAATASSWREDGTRVACAMHPRVSRKSTDRAPHRRSGGGVDEAPTPGKAPGLCERRSGYSPSLAFTSLSDGFVAVVPSG